MDIIEIKNLRLRAVIGFSAHELEVPQDIVVNLRIGVNDRLAGETDDPQDAFNYRTIAKAIIVFVEASRFNLVEKLAEEIARLALIEFNAPHIEVSVHKPGALRRSDSVGIRIVRKAGDYERNRAYISMGSNISPEENMVAALELLRRHTTVLAVSSVFKTPPQGFREQQPFLNMAVEVRTSRRPAQFKAEVVDRIERQLKRVRDPQNKNAPRSIDLDISLWNDEILEYGRKPWQIPDADVTRFAHVAIPLSDLAPDYNQPTAGKTLREIAASFDASQMRRVEMDLDLRSF